MTDKEKFIQLLDELCIEYSITDCGDIKLDSFEVDGAEPPEITFWENGAYKKFKTTTAVHIDLTPPNPHFPRFGELGGVQAHSWWPDF